MCLKFKATWIYFLRLPQLQVTELPPERYFHVIFLLYFASKLKISMQFMHLLVVVLMMPRSFAVSHCYLYKIWVAFSLSCDISMTWSTIAIFLLKLIP